MYCKKAGVVFPQPLVWRDVKDLSGYYEVSNYGQVRSVDRVISYTVRDRPITRLFKGKVLSPKYDKDGYESYGLSKDHVKYHVRGHRVVAQSFIPNPKGLGVVDHIDASVTHNTTWNLQWMTSAQNTIKHYAEEAGLDKSLSSLSKEDWNYISFLYKNDVEYRGICDNLGLGIKSPDTLWDVLSGRRLSTVTGFKRGDFNKRLHPTTKVSVDLAVTIIKERLLDKAPLKVLSKKYGIAESLVSRFCSGKRQPDALKLFKETYESSTTSR